MGNRPIHQCQCRECQEGNASIQGQHKQLKLLMSRLNEYELEDHIDYWYKGLKADRDEFVFAVTENSGDVAMVLITKKK